MTPRISALAALAFCLLGPAHSIPAEEFKTTDPVRIGMVSSLFNDIPPGLVEFVGGPL